MGQTPNHRSDWAAGLMGKATDRTAMNRIVTARMTAPLACAATALAVALALSSPVSVSAQDSGPTLEQRLSDPVYLTWITSAKVEGCVSCHFRGPTDEELIAGLFVDFARRIEMDRWLTNDKHTIARRRIEPFADQQSEDELMKLMARVKRQQGVAIEALQRNNRPVDLSQIGFTKVPEQWIGESNILSRRICDKLWGSGSVKTEAGYQKFRDQCLTCHGGYQKGDQGFDLSSHDDSQLGIDCLYCHQIGDNQKWVSDHASLTTASEWRMLPPDQKTAAGMRDLVDTSNQAQLCFDCHVGNRSKNMFVTHEMYAAGHPPIPSIELQAFCKEMPQHWQTPSELSSSLKDSAGRDEYFRTNYPGLTQTVDADKIFWNTRKMLVGALVARAQALDLYIESANSHQWADYSLYDCAACHHELASNSDRQRRGFPGAPGRPRENEWPDTLLALALQFYGYAAGTKEPVNEVRANQNQLTGLFADRPFGDPDRVSGVAEQLRRQIAVAIEQVERKPVTERIAKQMLLGLTRTPKQRMLTYDSARQVVWAVQTIADELRSEGSPLDPAIEKQIADLGVASVTGVEAALPSGREQFIYPKALEADLVHRAAFEPDRLVQALTRIRNQLVAQSDQQSTERTVPVALSRVSSESADPTRSDLRRDR
ncbi:hypothetical protein K227x_25790 [Rubripirellula lacrimiformis]|uniref:Cytochrome c-552/4 domain-containing protein n=1 Tax=Rubripirellula lacrimiformis TaxID=1930273 RepID=A0A517NAN7_9BACT|nr:cytochrome c3 family protein [Rubripirellula lacrimiformis]QDT04190.1 hypothetical protein K227x_25790 [Rubripirellula lacrimiformis]